MSLAENSARLHFVQLPVRVAEQLAQNLTIIRPDFRRLRDGRPRRLAEVDRAPDLGDPAVFLAGHVLQEAAGVVANSEDLYLDPHMRAATPARWSLSITW